MPDDIESHAAQFATLTDRKRELEAKLREVKKERDGVADKLEKAFVDAGIQNVTIKPPGSERAYTVYLNIVEYASPKDKRQAVQVLLEHGYDDFVSPNYSSCSALFRNRDVETLPPEIREAFEISERVSVRARKA